MRGISKFMFLVVKISIFNRRNWSAEKPNTIKTIKYKLCFETFEAHHNPFNVQTKVLS